MFADGEWNWDNPSYLSLTQKKDLPVTSMAAAKSNMWCAVGNYVIIINARSMKVEVGVYWLEDRVGVYWLEDRVGVY